jgi:sugar phosphate isomerase/epimerase
MKYGISSDTFANESLDIVLSLAKEFGTKYVELWASNLGSNGSPAVSRYAYSDKDIQKAKAQFEEAGCLVSCLAASLGNDESFCKRGPEEFSRELVIAVDAAHFFGAHIINHYSTYLCRDAVPNMDLLHKCWDAALERASEYGIVLALENEAMDMTYSPENMLEVIQEFDSPYFKTNFDATNYYHSGKDAFPYAYDLLKDEIAYVHIKNGRVYDERFCTDSAWIGVEPFTHSMAGNLIYYTRTKDGVVNIQGLLQRLKADGYCGYCTLEPHTSHENSIAAIKDEIVYLEQISLFDK